MANDNLVFGVTAEVIAPGQRREVVIRRSRSEPYVATTIYIVRAATLEETAAYHEREGLKFETGPGDRYYAFYMD